MSADPLWADAAYYATPARVFALLLGCVIALGPNTLIPPRPSAIRTTAGFVGLAAILGLFGVSTAMSASQRGILLVLAATLTAVLLWAIRGSQDAVGRLVDAAPLRWVGVRSYGLYLWHVPLIALADAVVPPLPGWGQIPGRLLAVAVAVCCASASHRWVELPVRRRGLRGAWVAATRGRPHLRTASAVTIAAALVAILAITVTAPRTTSLEDRLTGAVTSGVEPSYTGGLRAWLFSS